jgi:geranylgeranyl pyrophosphate synthase
MSRPLPSTDTLVAATRQELERLLLEYADVLPPAVIDMGKIALSAPGKVMAHLRGEEAEREKPARWPIFVLLSYLAAASDGDRDHWERAVPGACAVEIAMAAADLIDEWTDGDRSELLEGYGPGQAINTANLMLVMAQRVLARDAMAGGGERSLAALEALQGMLVEAAVGQHLDMLHSGGDIWGVALKTSARITSLKAGALIGGACRVGALLSGADEAVVEAVTRWGREVGSIAQIENDINDVLPEGMRESKEPEGKTDIARRKPTMPIVFTLRAEEGEPNALQRAYSEPVGTPADEDALRRSIVEAGGVQFGQLIINVHRENALNALSDLDALRPGASALLKPIMGTAKTPEANG